VALERTPLGDGRVSISDRDASGVRGFLDAWGSILTGLTITASSAAPTPKTLRYPFVKLTLDPRWRGALRLRGVLGRDEVPLNRTDLPYAYNAMIDRLHHAERLSPCTGNCPANVDARGQNYLVAEGRAPEAFELVRERNILPGVLGRICHHPCESACRRNLYDEPIAIRPLHRFVSEQYAQVRDARLSKLPVTQVETVGIVGSGPSGLAAALDLMRLGYAVTMYEKDDEPGGALNSGVPTYRLPREVLHGEIDDLVRMGLDLQCGVEVGVNVTLSELAERHHAVLIAAGLQDSRILPLPGAESEGVRGALEFLRDANWKGEVGVRGKRVVVVGGGNVAVDVARCALRCGAVEVHLASLESEEELPAHPWEIEEALDEGVIATCSVGPVEVLNTDGRVTGLLTRECLSVFDETGRFSPVFGENTSVLSCDVIVFAVGQAAKLERMVGETDVHLNERGNLIVDGQLLTTSAPGVFACGEVVTGPGSAIASIATGHEAAVSIQRFLRGQDLEEGRVARPVPVYDAYEKATLDGVEQSRRRVVMPMAPAAERVRDFRPVELGITHQEALTEAARCLRCQSEVCVGCTFCARTCPDYCIKVERIDDPGARCLTRYDLDLSKCCFCGLCAEQCPTNALVHSGQYELSFYHRDLMLFDKGEMLRDPSPTRATGRDGIESPSCPVPGRPKA
jgi:NADPH-dependent glutamate synthase beta subunit-like oxidoreductase